MNFNHIPRAESPQLSPNSRRSRSKQIQRDHPMQQQELAIDNKNYLHSPQTVTLNNEFGSEFKGGGEQPTPEGFKFGMNSYKKPLQEAVTRSHDRSNNQNLAIKNDHPVYLNVQTSFRPSLQESVESRFQDSQNIVKSSHNYLQSRNFEPSGDNRTTNLSKFADQKNMAREDKQIKSIYISVNQSQINQNQSYLDFLAQKASPNTLELQNNQQAKIEQYKSQNGPQILSFNQNEGSQNLNENQGQKQFKYPMKERQIVSKKSTDQSLRNVKDVKSSKKSPLIPQFPFQGNEKEEQRRGSTPTNLNDQVIQSGKLTQFHMRQTSPAFSKLANFSKVNQRPVSVQFGQRNSSRIGDYDQSSLNETYTPQNVSDVQQSALNSAKKKKYQGLKYNQIQLERTFKKRNKTAYVQKVASNVQPNGIANSFINSKLNIYINRKLQHKKQKVEDTIPQQPKIVIQSGQTDTNQESPDKIQSRQKSINIENQHLRFGANPKNQDMKSLPLNGQNIATIQTEDAIDSGQSRNHSQQQHRKVVLQGNTTLSSREATKNNSVNTSIMKGLELLTENAQEINPLSLTGESIKTPHDTKKKLMAAEIAKAAALAHQMNPDGFHEIQNIIQETLSNSDLIDQPPIQMTLNNSQINQQKLASTVAHLECRSGNPTLEKSQFQSINQGRLSLLNSQKQLLQTQFGQYPQIQDKLPFQQRQKEYRQLLDQKPLFLASSRKGIGFTDRNRNSSNILNERTCQGLNLKRITTDQRGLFIGDQFDLKIPQTVQAGFTNSVRGRKVRCNSSYGTCRRGQKSMQKFGTIDPKKYHQKQQMHSPPQKKPMDFGHQTEPVANPLSIQKAVAERKQRLTRGQLNMLVRNHPLNNQINKQVYRTVENIGVNTTAQLQLDEDKNKAIDMQSFGLLSGGMDFALQEIEQLMALNASSQHQHSQIASLEPQVNNSSLSPVRSSYQVEKNQNNLRLELDNPETGADVRNSNQDTIRISYNMDQQRKSRVIYSVKKQSEIETGSPQNNRVPFLYTAEELDKQLHDSLNYRGSTNQKLKQSEFDKLGQLRGGHQGMNPVGPTGTTGLRYSANNHPIAEVQYPGGFAASHQVKPNSDLLQQMGSSIDENKEVNFAPSNHQQQSPLHQNIGQTKRLEETSHPSNLNKDVPMQLSKVNFSKIMITVGSKDQLYPHSPNTNILHNDEAELLGAKDHQQHQTLDQSAQNHPQYLQRNAKEAEIAEKQRQRKIINARRTQSASQVSKVKSDPFKGAPPNIDLRNFKDGCQNDEAVMATALIKSAEDQLKAPSSQRNCKGDKQVRNSQISLKVKKMPSLKGIDSNEMNFSIPTKLLQFSPNDARRGNKHRRINSGSSASRNFSRILSPTEHQIVIGPHQDRSGVNRGFVVTTKTSSITTNILKYQTRKTVSNFENSISPQRPTSKLSGSNKRSHSRGTNRHRVIHIENREMFQQDPMINIATGADPNLGQNTLREMGDNQQTVESKTMQNQHSPNQKVAKSQNSEINSHSPLQENPQTITQDMVVKIEEQDEFQDILDNDNRLLQDIRERGTLKMPGKQDSMISRDENFAAKTLHPQKDQILIHQEILGQTQGTNKQNRQPTPLSTLLQSTLPMNETMVKQFQHGSQIETGEVNCEITPLTKQITEKVPQNAKETTPFIVANRGSLIDPAMTLKVTSYKNFISSEQTAKMVSADNNLFQIKAPDTVKELYSVNQQQRDSLHQERQQISRKTNDQFTAENNQKENYQSNSQMSPVSPNSSHKLASNFKIGSPEKGTAPFKSDLQKYVANEINGSDATKNDQIKKNLDEEDKSKKLSMGLQQVNVKRLKPPTRVDITLKQQITSVTSRQEELSKPMGGLSDRKLIKGSLGQKSSVTKRNFNFKRVLSGHDVKMTSPSYTRVQPTTFVSQDEICEDQIRERFKAGFFGKKNRQPRKNEMLFQTQNENRALNQSELNTTSKSVKQKIRPQSTQNCGVFRGHKGQRLQRFYQTSRGRDLNFLVEKSRVQTGGSFVKQSQMSLKRRNIEQKSTCFSARTIDVSSRFQNQQVKIQQNGFDQQMNQFRQNFKTIDFIKDENKQAMQDVAITDFAKNDLNSNERSKSRQIYSNIARLQSPDEENQEQILKEQRKVFERVNNGEQQANEEVSNEAGSQHFYRVNTPPFSPSLPENMSNSHLKKPPHHQSNLMKQVAGVSPRANPFKLQQTKDEPLIVKEGERSRQNQSMLATSKNLPTPLAETKNRRSQTKRQLLPKKETNLSTKPSKNSKNRPDEKEENKQRDLNSVIAKKTHSEKINPNDDYDLKSESKKESIEQKQKRESKLDNKNQSKQ